MSADSSCRVKGLSRKVEKRQQRFSRFELTNSYSVDNRAGGRIYCKTCRLRSREFEKKIERCVDGARLVLSNSFAIQHNGGTHLPPRKVGPNIVPRVIGPLHC
jgi:hypothetical protein